MPLYMSITKTRLFRITCCLAASIACACTGKSQQNFRFDNKLYKAVYINEAAKLMHDNPNYVLIDVRSPGEYADTSTYTHLNIGHLKGAININIDSMPAHLEQLKQYGDKNIFLICSHSQRSRRVSKYLADNGFTNVYNINGGMSVVNESSQQSFPLKNTLFVSDKPYKDVASADALAVIQNPATAIIDIRSAAQFASTDTSSIANNIGRLVNAVNLPFKEFKEKITALHIQKEKPILLYDRSGDNSADAAVMLTGMGYKHVYNLYEGLAAFVTDNYLEPAKINKVITNPPPFKIISIRQAISLLSKPNNFTIVDARPAEEFNNKAKAEYLNVGRIAKAVNIASMSDFNTVAATLKKDAPIMLYGSYSSDLDADVCKLLVEKGFTNIYYLYQGIGRFAWACYNVENCKDGVSVLTDHEGLY